jgi:isoquinoline 1-oxidoreductase beta subunit
MAVAAGKDHRDYVLDLLGPAWEIHNLTVGGGWNYGENPDLHPIDIGRMRRVIERATAEAGWGRKIEKGRGLVCRRLCRHCATPFMQPSGSASVAFLLATS